MSRNIILVSSFPARQLFKNVKIIHSSLLSKNRWAGWPANHTLLVVYYLLTPSDSARECVPQQRAPTEPKPCQFRYQDAPTLHSQLDGTQRPPRLMPEWAGVCDSRTRGRSLGKGRAECRLPAEERKSKMATTKRVLYVGEKAWGLGGGWANRAASGSWRGAGQVSGRGRRRAAV